MCLAYQNTMIWLLSVLFDWLFFEIDPKQFIEDRLRSTLDQ